MPASVQAAPNAGQVCVYGLKSNPAPPVGFNPSYPDGFTGASQFAYNGSAYASGSAMRLTDGRTNQASSVFFIYKRPVDKFHTTFSFQGSAGANIADGLTFTIQGISPYAVGGSGSGLGFGTTGSSPATGIKSSVAIKFDVYSNAGEGANSTGIFTNGATPTNPATALPATIDLHSGHRFNVAMAYDGTTLSVTITDATINATATQNYAVNIPSVVGASTAYVGFTAGTGGLSSTQDILNWSYTTP